MNIDESVIIREKFKSFFYDIKTNTKRIKELVKHSKDIFQKLYKDKGIAGLNQFLLYSDDIIFLDNWPDFRKKYFVINGIKDFCLDKLFNNKQFGDVVVISMEDAKKLLKEAALDKFKKV